MLYSRRPERPRRGMLADGGPDRPSGWAAGRVTHFLTQTLACMHECIQAYVDKDGNEQGPFSSSQMCGARGGVAAVRRIKTLFFKTRSLP